MLKIKFLRNFFLLSLLIAVVAPAYLLLVVHPSYRVLLNEHTEDSAVQLANYLDRSIGLQSFLWSRQTLPLDIEERLQPFYGDKHLVKLRLFSPLGEILHSTDSEEVGEINNKDYFLSIVKQGKVFSKVVRKEGKTAEGNVTAKDLVETYVPFMQGSEFVGAIEIYYDITDSHEQLTLFTWRAVSISIAIAPVSDASGRIVNYVATKLDVTERMKAEQLLHDKNSEMERFVYTVSHDLKSPLVTIKGFLGVLS